MRIISWLILAIVVLVVIVFALLIIHGFTQQRQLSAEGPTTLKAALRRHAEDLAAAQIDEQHQRAETVLVELESLSASMDDKHWKLFTEHYQHRFEQLLTHSSAAHHQHEQIRRTAARNQHVIDELRRLQR